MLFAFCFLLFWTQQSNAQQGSFATCNIDYPNIAWQGPYTMDVCSNDPLGPTITCNPPKLCCFTFTYYARSFISYDPPPTQPVWDVQIVSVKPGDGCLSCYYANKDQIHEKFLWKFYQSKNLTFQELWGDINYCAYKNKIVTRGGCVINGTSILCNNQAYCCGSQYKICYDNNGNVISVENTGSSFFYYDENNNLINIQDCLQEPVSCANSHIECNNYLYYDKFCGGLCFGEWNEEERTIPFRCPGCTITFRYLRKEAQDCIPPRNDTKLVGDFILKGCVGCLYTDAEIISAITEWMMQPGNVFDYPEELPCRENEYITMAKCWRRTFDQQKQWWIFSSCNDEFCCERRYRVCPNETYTLLDGNYSIQPCSEPDCSAFCIAFPTMFPGEDNTSGANNIDEQLYNEVEVMPNPSIDNINIVFRSNLRGTVKITISDYLGNILFEQVSVKTDERLKVAVDTKGIRTGVYLYQVEVNGHLMNSGKLSLIK